MLTLPPEIRNQIYSYLFEPQRVQIHRYKDRKTNKYRLGHTLLPPRDPETQNLKTLSRSRNRNTKTQIKTKDNEAKPKGNKVKANGDNKRKNVTNKNQTQLCLPFASKQFYSDTISLLYSCTQFVFPSQKCISRFLIKVPKSAQAFIQHIELHRIMNNEPRLTTYRSLKARSDKRWFDLCEEIAGNFLSLKAVHVNLTVFEPLIYLEVGEAWSRPVLVLGRREGSGHGVGTLRFAKVKLNCARFGEEKVREVERLLEKELMDPIAVQVREDEEFARELAGPARGKVLRLVFR